MYIVVEKHEGTTRKLTLSDVMLVFPEEMGFEHFPTTLQ